MSYNAGRMSLAALTHALIRDVRGLRFGPPVTHVYNPLTYAHRPLNRYFERFGAPGRRILLVGMNPGPWGMVQTGIPFGEVNAVRDWLGVEAPVGKPPHQHPKRPVQGFACPRSEVSGARLWGWARDRFGTPGRFFSRFFVLNYCPLCFLEASGRNRTPDKLCADERKRLFAACDRALQRSVDYFKPRFVIGIGAFAEKRLRAALQTTSGVVIGRILHPSPASPLANMNWAARVDSQLNSYGIRLPAPARSRRGVKADP